MRRLLIFILPFLILCSCASDGAYIEPKMPLSPAFIINDFEKENTFIAVNDSWDFWDENVNKTSCELSDSWSSEGSKSLLCSDEGAVSSTSKNRSIWAWEFPEITDISQYTYIAFDVNNVSGTNLKISLAIQGTDSWIWEESSQYSLPTGVHSILVTLSDFSNDVLTDIKNIMFQITDEHEKALFYFDNVRLYQ